MKRAAIPMTNLPRVLIIGGGFGGINLAKALRNEPFQVVMFDRHNYHTFQPLLYQVATGGLEPDSIAFPLRKIFSRQSNFIFRMGEVLNVNPEQKIVETSIGEVSYDHLIIASGTDTNFFGLTSLEENAVGMKSIPESLDLRSMVLQNFEEALQTTEIEIKDILLKFIVVGGGPTGVEMAGALAELKRFVLPNDYPELDLRQMEIHLIEAGGQLLAGMSDSSSRNAKKALEKLGVHIWYNTRVTDYDGKVIHTHDGQTFEAATVIWAAGIQGNVIEGIGKDVIERGSRLAVDDLNRVKGYKNIYAIGDVALMKTEAYPNGHPQVAPAAIQQAKNLAKNLRRIHKNQESKLKPFAYFDKGAMATIGRNKAVVDFRNIHLKGFIAWLGWMGLHLLFLLGFRNKLVVFVNWVWSYFTYDKGTRLIIRPFKRKPIIREPEKVSV